LDHIALSPSCVTGFLLSIGRKVAPDSNVKYVYVNYFTKVRSDRHGRKQSKAKIDAPAWMVRVSAILCEWLCLLKVLAAVVRFNHRHQIQSRLS